MISSTQKYLHSPLARLTENNDHKIILALYFVCSKTKIAAYSVIKIWEVLQTIYGMV